MQTQANKPLYDYTAAFFGEGLLSVEKGGKWGYINPKGEVAIPLIYDHADTFSGGVVSVKKNGKWGYIDQTGKVVVPLVYEDMAIHSEIIVATIGRTKDIFGMTGEKLGSIEIIENNVRQRMTRWL